MGLKYPEERVFKFAVSKTGEGSGRPDMPLASRPWAKAAGQALARFGLNFLGYSSLSFLNIHVVQIGLEENGKRERKRKRKIILL